MKYASSNSNPLECVELRVSTPTQAPPDGSVVVLANLEFGEHELRGEKLAYVVRVKRAKLRVETGGHEIDPNSRFGRFDRPNEAVDEYREVVEDALEGEAEIGTSSAKAKAKARTTRKREGDRRDHSQRVRAMAKGVWIIAEPDGETPLEGRYINDEQTFCVLETDAAKGDGNTIYLNVTADQSDLTIGEKRSEEVNQLSARISRSTNKRKMWDLLAKQAVATRAPDGYVLARATLKPVIDDDNA